MDATRDVVVDTDVLPGACTPNYLLSPNTETGRAWARIKSGWEMRSRPITFADASIAAAALQLNVPQVTHDASDYGAVENLTILTAPVVR
jgi:predicted nucleic acid-binding protein